ncbi:hypothetical protein BJV78DRAFT_1281388 [Lactifluus subvellereus]|nr:hypothetical protein BJV78DRAFT_1281388 [Lactifluus subvellereus]
MVQSRKDDHEEERSEPSFESPQATDANTTGSSAEPAAPAPSSGNWQAIWSPAHNAYYFYNTITQETTWVNPLQSSPAAGAGEATTPADPSPSTSTAPAAPAPAPASAPTQEEGPSAGPSSGATPVPASVAQIYALQEAAAAQGIDPSLAHLDPSLAGPSAPGAAYSFAARFNAHTGTFTRPDGRDPTHLSEYERMKRMSSVYFDMGQWEQDVAQRKKQEDEDAANGKKRKRPGKKDLERFKEQKRLKKIAKTAWLRT